MRDGLRYLLLLLAGLMAVLFVISFTAWGLTTYGSIRHLVGDLAAQPDKAAGLQGQYEDMATYFAGGSGDTFTYHFMSAPVAINKTQAAGMGDSDVISLVLDIYVSGLYNNDLPSGSPGFAGTFIGPTGNLLYGVTALIFAIAFILFTAGAVLWFPESPRPSHLKSAGKTLAVVSVIVFLVFTLLPGLLKSLVWGSLSNTSSARDLLSVLEPNIMAPLLWNTILVILVAAAIYGAGYWLETRGDAGAVFKESRPSAPQAPENRKRRSL